MYVAIFVDHMNYNIAMPCVNCGLYDRSNFWLNNKNCEGILLSKTKFRSNCIYIPTFRITTGGSVGCTTWIADNHSLVIRVYVS